MKKQNCWLILSFVIFTLYLRGAERNVLLIVTDDQSKTLGCYGDTVAHTPALDELAEQGTVFTNAFATTASCSASRSVILTGTYNHANGQYGHAHDFHKFTTFYDVVSLSLPVALQRNGYRTGRIGKYHVAPEVVYHFETVIPHGEARNDVDMAERCRGFIESEDDRPFFLYYATMDSHRSGMNDPESNDEWKPNLFGNLPFRQGYEGVEEVIYEPEDVLVPPFLPDTNASRKELAHYYQAVARIDQGVGRLLSILKTSGLLNKTLIIFTSDHGMAFAGAKTTLYEGAMQVPFIVFDPYKKSEKVCSEAMISHADITPSILEYAGALDLEKNRPKNWIDPDEFWKGTESVESENRSGGLPFDHYHGRSWYGILGESKPDGWDEVFASHTFHEITMYYPMRVIRNRHYKLIWNIAHGLPYPFSTDLWSSSTWQAQFNQGMDANYGSWTIGGYIHRPQFELFDLQQDPWESNNLAKSQTHQGRLKTMIERLKLEQKRTDDPWVSKWNYE